MSQGNSVKRTTLYDYCSAHSFTSVIPSLIFYSTENDSVLHNHTKHYGAHVSMLPPLYLGEGERWGGEMLVLWEGLLMERREDLSQEFHAPMYLILNRFPHFTERKAPITYSSFTFCSSSYQRW